MIYMSQTEGQNAQEQKALDCILTSMATLGAHMDPAREGLSAGITASRGGEGARQLMRALAAGTVADLRQRARGTCPWE